MLEFDSPCELAGLLILATHAKWRAERRARAAALRRRSALRRWLERWRAGAAAWRLVAASGPFSPWSRWRRWAARGARRRRLVDKYASQSTPLYSEQQHI